MTSTTFANPHRGLVATLAIIAGMVDLTSFVSLGGIFTAHVTGNLVIIAAHAVDGRPAKLAQMLAVPVFMITVAVVWLLVRRIGQQGAVATRAVLLLHFLLLLAVLFVSVLGHAGQSPTGAAALAAVLLAASAMAAQNALLHMQIAGSPATAMMTGNLVSAIVVALDSLSGESARRAAARERLRSLLWLLGGFLLGCVVAAAALQFERDWAWALPVTLAGLLAASGCRDK